MSSLNGNNTSSTPSFQTRAVPETHLSIGLENLWRTRAQADVIVHIQDTKIPCHKAVLMAASPYFEAMFNSGMQEAKSAEIHFKDMDASTFELVLEFIYTGKVIITNANGFALLEAASLLQILILFRKCEDILSQHITIKTSLDTWRFASLHSSRKLRTRAFKVILGHFDEFAKQDDFMTLSCVELLEIVKDNRLNVPSEEFVVNKVIDWGNFSDVNKTELGKVFANLRLCQLSNEHLFALKKYFSTTVDSDIARNSIDEAFEFKHVPARRQATSSLVAKFRNCNPVEEVLVLVGGIKETPVKRTVVLEVLAYSFLKCKWFQLDSLPQSCGYFYATGSTGENIYITGGTGNETGLLEYQATFNNWKAGTALVKGRYAHAMATMSGALYILGGCTGKGGDKTVVSSIERYSFGTKKWEECGDLVQPVAWPSSTVTDNRVLVYGGIRKEDLDSKPPPYRPSNLIQYFDISANVCTQITISAFPAVSEAIQVNCHTYLFDHLANVSQYDALDTAPATICSIDVLRRHKQGLQYCSAVQMNGLIYITFRSGDDDHLKQIIIINPGTWEECKPPVLLPYPRTVEGCARIIMEKKFLTKVKNS